MKKIAARVLLSLIFIAAGMELALGGIDSSAPPLIQIFHMLVLGSFTIVGFVGIVNLSK